MASATLEQVRKQHDAAVEQNRTLGVVEYRSGEKQADAVYEVTEGYKILPGRIRLGPGQRFHPTEKQLRDGSLRGKARELTASEYRDLKREPKPGTRARVQGADIGLRALPMAEGTLKLAIGAGLTEADFEGVEPDGADGQHTRRQVQAIIDAKAERAA